MAVPRLAPLAGVLAAVAVAVAPALAASPEQRMLKSANQLRASLGMGTLAWDAEAARGCELHNRYILLTGGDADPHEETRGRRGYTEAGHRAGQRSNLASASGGSRNPWINAPYHLAGMLDPDLRATGIAFTKKRRAGTQWCMSVSGTEAPGADGDRFFSYPRDGGKAPRAQVVAESPTVPAYDLGLDTPSRTLSSKTGPNILVFQQSIDGYEHCRLVIDDETDQATYYDRRTGQPVPQEQCGELVLPVDLLTSARMTGPDGPVTVRTHGKEHPKHRHRRAILLPVKPLKAGARYTVSVTFSTDPESGGGEARSVTSTFSFTATKKTLR